MPSRFGYTGPHNRRGGTGDRMGRPYAGGPSGAAQKMVCLSSSQGTCVCRTHTGPATRKSIGPDRRRRTGVARKNTPNGTRRVSFIKNQFEAPDVSRPKQESQSQKGRTLPSSRIRGVEDTGCPLTIPNTKNDAPKPMRMPGALRQPSPTYAAVIAVTGCAAAISSAMTPCCHPAIRTA